MVSLTKLLVQVKEKKVPNQDVLENENKCNVRVFLCYVRRSSRIFFLDSSAVLSKSCSGSDRPDTTLNVFAARENFATKFQSVSQV